MVKEPLFTVHWSLHARANLKDIYDYIKTDSPQNAIKVVGKMVRLSMSLSYLPFRYAECPELPTKNKIYRKVNYASYKIVYRVKRSRVEILSIFHSSKNPEKLKALRKVKA